MNLRNKSMVIMLIISCMILLGADDGCIEAETDRTVYTPGEEGTTTILNNSPFPFYLQECTIFTFERFEEGNWIEIIQDDDCPSYEEEFPEPKIEIKHEEVLKFPFIAPEIGKWRIRYEILIMCEPDEPVKSENCKSHVLFTPPFDVLPDSSSPEPS